MVDNNEGKGALEDSENLEKLAAKLLKDQTIDFTSLFSLASKIIQDDSIMNLSEGLREMQEDDAVSEENIELEDIEALRKQMASMKADLIFMKREISELKEQNASLIGIYMRLIKAANQDFKKGVGLIAEISKLLK
ncbi:MULTISPECIES: hypothetical protein [Bacillaceae]|uniref:hypothetical protein n=1 Tax=Bacillaceae TaxID=186817 RepID=UPI001A8E12D0|nr:hypothetical protein [Bacillus sp. NTK034]MBN8202876.1 hypothetical protein [Bacillus sp. NTK034]